MVVGMDGARGGWITAAWGKAGIEMRFWVRFQEAWEFYCRRALVILVDIPIGLPWKGAPERKCDRQARKFLGFPRSASIFSPPCRESLYASSYREACSINRQILGKALSRQAWNLSPKIKEVNEFLLSHREALGVVRESHPEVVFKGLAGRSARYSKRHPLGYEERLEVVKGFCPEAELILSSEEWRGRRLDCLDSLLLVTAAALALRAGFSPEVWRTFPPEGGKRDPAGLPMEVVWVKGGLET